MRRAAWDSVGVGVGVGWRGGRGRRLAGAGGLVAILAAGLAGCAGSSGGNFQVDTLPSATSTLVSGRATVGSVAVSGARVVEAPGGGPASIYLDIRVPHGQVAGQPEALEGITSNAAGVTLATAAGRPARSLPVPASGRLTLGPGGPHGLVAATALRRGGTVVLSLTFARTGIVTVFAPVTGPAGAQ